MNHLSSKNNDEESEKFYITDSKRNDCYSFDSFTKKFDHQITHQFQYISKRNRLESLNSDTIKIK